MPKSMFDSDDGLHDLSRVLDLFNSAMVDTKNVKTVEELQAVINNLTRVINEIRKSLPTENRAVNVT
jgi:hypothetical protein